MEKDDGHKTTTVRIETPLYKQAKLHKIKFSPFLNDSLRIALNQSDAQRLEVEEEVKRLEIALSISKGLLKKFDAAEINAIKKDKAAEFDKALEMLKRMHVKVIECTDKGQFNKAVKVIAEHYNMEYNAVFNRVVK